MEYNFFNIDKTVYKVSDFMSWQKIGSLILSPNFQRRPHWSSSAKSYLVDTIIRGLPIPIIIIRERLDLSASIEPKREIVDGQQRLRTIIAFIAPMLLEDYQEGRDDVIVSKTHNKELAGKSFRQMPVSIQQRILNYSFSVHVLPSETSDRDVLQIFARLNSTGTKLNEQEIRNAEFFGEFKRLAYDIAYSHLNRWRSWKIFSETDIARMIEVEETSDLMLLMLIGEHGKTQRNLNAFYRKYEDVLPESSEIERRFGDVMDTIDDLFDDRLKETVYSRKALFHTLFALIYDQLYGLGSELKKMAPKKIRAGILDELLEASDRIKNEEIPEELAKKLRGATSDAGSRTARLAFIKQFIS
ncbi:MAG: DUF262 domain-containing protein [Syntrophorhabdaceae bacterium]|nr:DUF262 domain-containing protein [Syntrophorhabdaceae bacterium]